MTIAGSLDGHHGPGILGTRSRHVKPLAIAGLVLTLIVLIRASPLFHPRYESGFSVVNPSKPPANPIIKGPPPAELPGDDFYITDALHHALNPPPPPPPPPPEDAPPPRAFPDSVAVLMETDVTRVPNLVPITLHFANLLGPKWPIVILTLQATWVEPASPAFRRYMAEQRIRIHFLPEDTEFSVHSAVSIFMTKPWFWEQFESADRVLLFQADSILCSKSAAHLEDFAEWDLIGAPIAGDFGAGYNGGLSLRNPKLMLEVVRDPELNHLEATLATFEARQQFLRTQVEPDESGRTGIDRANEEYMGRPGWQEFEDQFFYHVLATHKPEAKLPPTDVAKTFAVETMWYETPLGYHQPFRWLSDEQKAQVWEYCPEATLLQAASHFH